MACLGLFRDDPVNVFHLIVARVWEIVGADPDASQRSGDPEVVVDYQVRLHGQSQSLKLLGVAVHRLFEAVGHKQFKAVPAKLQSANSVARPDV